MADHKRLTAVAKHCAEAALLKLSSDERAELQALYMAKNIKGADDWARAHMVDNVSYHVGLTIVYALQCADPESVRDCAEHYAVACGYAMDDPKGPFGTITHCTAKSHALLSALKVALS